MSNQTPYLIRLLRLLCLRRRMVSDLNLKCTAGEVVGELGFPRLLDMPAVSMRADPQTMPGIF